MNNEVSKQDTDDLNESTVTTAEGKKIKSNIGLVLIAIVFSIAALVISGLSYFLTGELNRKTAILEDTIGQLESADAAIRTMETGNIEFSRKLEELAREQGSFVSSLDSLYQERTNDDLDWAMAEIEQLLIIATHRLALEADIETALAAMQAADNRLRDIGDPRLLAVRRQLGSDINALRAVNAVDITGMAIHLADFVNRAADLPLRQVRTIDADPETGDNPETGDESPGWKRFLHSVWQELKGLVIISTDTADASFALLPEQQYYLTQNLGLQLQAARLNVLRRDTTNFRDSINISKNWLETYFDLSDSGVTNILDSLSRMSAIELNPEMPDISSSLETLRVLIKDRAEQDSSATGSAGVPEL